VRKLVAGSVWEEEGRRVELHGEQGAAALMGVGGGAPVGLGGDGRAEELRDVEKKLARGWVGGEEERRRGLRVEVARRRETAGDGVAERRGEEELGSEVRWWRGKNEIGPDEWLKRW
jgi:hypothetical protein